MMPNIAMTGARPIGFMLAPIMTPINAATTDWKYYTLPHLRNSGSALNLYVFTHTSGWQLSVQPAAGQYSGSINVGFLA